MGIAEPVAHSTLADANESRDGRIYFEFAQRLIVKARALYVGDEFGFDLTNTVYALDGTTIDLCLSMFPWAPFRSTKAPVKLHTPLDLPGSIPSFIHISDSKLHDVNALDLIIIEAGAFYIMDRAYLNFSTHCIRQKAPSSHAPSEISIHDVCIRRQWIAAPD